MSVTPESDGSPADAIQPDAMQRDDDQHGVIAWWARNHVAANLLMFGVLLFGVMTYGAIQKRMFPDFELNTVQVTVPFRGGSPQDVEEGVVIKIEEAIQDIKGIKRVRSTATENNGQVSIETESGTDIDQILNDVKLRVDAIATFPAQAERPVITKLEAQNQVLWLSLHGQLDDTARKRLAQEIRDELLAIPSVNQAQVVGDRQFEISIDVSEQVLRQYGLTLNDVAQAVRRSSLDLPAGTIKSDGGDISLRTTGQAYTRQEYERIVLRTETDGTRLLLGDIAAIRDGFEEVDGFARFNGTPSLSIRVLSVGDQNDLQIAADVHAYVERKRASLAAGVELDAWGDASYYLQGRLDMMFKNMLQGALLVFLTLTLFLRLRIAFWVIVGIPVAFCGALWLMPNPILPVSINMLSLFGFILVLGIIVDDAIIIGESVYSEIRAHGHSLATVVRGANKVATAATFGVLTTVVAFAPMLFIEGFAGPFFQALSMVVILCLIFSLIESKWILPAHLAHMKLETIPVERQNALIRFQRTFRDGMERMASETYPRWLAMAMHNRALTVAAFLSLLLLALALLVGGVVRQEVFPNVPSDFIQSSVTMNNGTAPAARNAALERMETALQAVEADYRQAFPDQPDGFLRYILLFTQGDIGGQLVVELSKPELRRWDAREIEQRWRDKVGEIAGARELRYFSTTNPGGGSALDFQLAGNNYLQLEQAAEALSVRLRDYDGVFDVRSSFSSGAQEIQLKIKPAAEALGLSQSELARQVRQAFYGEEAQRIQRGRDDVRVMVRYPRSERQSMANLENLRVRTPDGAEVPFHDVADIRIGTSYAAINRTDRKRTVSVTADIDPEKVESSQVIDDVSNNVMPALLASYPGVHYDLTGAAEEQQKFVMDFLQKFMIALVGIYVLLAVPLKSYLQPFLIMSAIPYGFVGAVVGHWVTGQTFSMMSFFGLIALAGVVVNDSLVMVDFVNRAREEGLSREAAIMQAGSKRFRAIILTSLTTFFGLLPILFETSLQAQFLKPMATALGFGILFATVITLFLIPTLYLLLGDGKRALRRLFVAQTATEPGGA